MPAASPALSPAHCDYCCEQYSESTHTRSGHSLILVCLFAFLPALFVTMSHISYCALLMNFQNFTFFFLGGGFLWASK